MRCSAIERIVRMVRRHAGHGRTDSRGPDADTIPVLLRKLAVETIASTDELRQIESSIRRAWESVGREQPFYSILSDDRFLPERLNEFEHLFWKSGEDDAAELVDYLANLGLVAPKSTTLLEYGCGVGRVTLPLANAFRDVIACDISEPHLSLARNRAREHGCANIRTVLIESAVDIEFEPCDVFYSRLVLQHNPPPLIGHLLRKLIRALRPGGCGIFQIPTYLVGYDFRVADYLCSPRPPKIEMHCLPQPDLFALLADEGIRTIQVREDNDPGHRDTFVSNTFVVAKASAANGSPQP